MFGVEVLVVSVVAGIVVSDGMEVGETVVFPAVFPVSDRVVVVPVMLMVLVRVALVRFAMATMVEV